MTHSLYFVKVDTENWKLSKCSCFYWSKNYFCKHMISVCYRLQLMTFPDAAKNIKIGHSRSRGRPANNPGALKRLRKEASEEETILSFSESEHEEEAIEVVPKKRGRKRKEKQIELADDDDEFDLFEGQNITTVEPTSQFSASSTAKTSKPAAKKPRTNTNPSNSSQANPSNTKKN